MALFSKSKDKKPKTNVQEMQIPKAQKNEPEISVHTMPKRFIKAGDGSKKGPNYLMIGIIGVILIVGVGVAVIFVLNSILGDVEYIEPTVEVNTNTEIVVNENTNIATTGDEETVKVEVEGKSGITIGSATLQIPKGALSQDIDVDIVGFIPDRNIKSPEGYNLSQVLGAVYSFTPDGITFRQAVTLTLTYNQEEVKELGYREGDLKIAFGQDIDNWEILSSSKNDNNKNTVSVQLKDFVSQGKYGIVSVNAIKSAEEQEELEEDQDSNENTNTNSGESLTFETTGSIPPSRDTDDDELTDVEEDLLGTIFDNPDSDGDGYIDGEEVKGTYDPTVGNGALLKDLTTMDTYTNVSFGYSVVYPKKWVAQDTGENREKAYFTSSTGEFVEVMVEQNPSELTARDWYANQNSDEDTGQLESVTVGDLVGIKTIEGRTIYLAAEDKMYILSYSVGLRKDMNFYSIFIGMVNSFTLVTETEETDVENQGQSATEENTNESQNTNVSD